MYKQRFAVERFSDELYNFINNVEWIFAKKYASTWPHHYIVRDRVDENLFMKLVEHIRRFGYEGSFYKKKITYFDENGLVYWTMGKPIDKTTVINRCPKESTYEYRLKSGILPADTMKNGRQVK